MKKSTITIKEPKLVFTGGHHTPALAVIRHLPSVFNIYWFGHKFSMHGVGRASAEYKTITSLGIPFYDLRAGKVYRTWNLVEWLRVPFGFMQSLWWLLKIRPDLIISFGGYLAVPVVVSGWFLGIPSVTHEQTVVSGWANRVIAKFARKIFVTWRESRKYFPKEKVSVVGLPLRNEVLAGVQSSSSARLVSQLSGLPTIYVTGGKQGSRVINRAVVEALPQLLTRFNVLHQCGSLDYERVAQDTKDFPGPGTYILKPYFGEAEIGVVLDAADFVISRAGANTVYELAALGKPAIFVPIPWVSHNEQRKNAQILELVGSAIIIEQEDLSAQTLLDACEEMTNNLVDYRRNATNARTLVKYDSAEMISEFIVSYVAKL